MKTIEPTPAMLKFQREHPCPICGAVPVEVTTKAVEEFRMAPRDNEGRPMLYAPYEMGTTVGLRYETTAVCEQDHAYHVADQIKTFDEPRQGPPMLP